MSYRTAGLTRRATLGLGTALAVTPALAQAGRAFAAPEPNTTGPDPFPQESPDRPGLEEASLTDLQKALSSGLLSSVDLVRYYLSRIERLDRHGPTLGSVLETNPDAIAQARTLDEERRAGRLRHPLLHGIPVLLKDVVETADRMHTTAGSLALLGARPAQDATVAARLRAAGAVLLGKANLTEWAGSEVTRVNGWSTRGGQCRNPYRLDRSPSGSSAGPAVAVSANLCSVAIGAETNGSILSPAAVNGVVGLKPTVGLTSRAGVIPCSPTQDSIGPLCRTVADAAAVLGVIAGPDPRDAASAAAVGHTRSDYTRHLDPDGLRGARIGVPRQVFFGYSSHADAVAEQALRTLAAAGAILVDPADIPTAQEMATAEAPGTVALYESKHSFDSYLASTPGDHPRSLTELIAFNEQHAGQELRYFDQSPLKMVDTATDGDLTSERYRKALADTRDMARTRGLDAVLAEHRLDALVMPTWNPAWKIDYLNGDFYLGGSSGPASLAGYPAITVPAGTALSLPLGITFTGPAWSEPVLLRLAYAFEQRTRARTKPGLLPAETGL
ncbi:MULTISPECIES: amidase [unclassified Kitasatospora]|uniref:amidase n=1 Tax=unclassified Kitasatospora TaxID=2633591 RepID=UPI0033D0E3FD